MFRLQFAQHVSTPFLLGAASLDSASWPSAPELDSLAGTRGMHE
jgi:hypothetical protein